MARFTIIGAHKLSGKEIVTSVSADTESVARLQAQKQNILVSKIDRVDDPSTAIAVGLLKAIAVLGVLALVAAGAVGIWVVLANTRADESTAWRDRLGDILGADRVAPAVLQAGLPLDIPKPTTPLKHPIVTTYDEFQDWTTIQTEIALDGRCTIHVSHDYSGQVSPPGGDELMFHLIYALPRQELMTEVYWIVDSVRFQSLPGEYSKPSTMIAGSDVMHSVAFDIGPDLAELIGRSSEARLKFANQEHTLSEEAKRSVLEMVRLAR
ncbi:MAG: hypothetical protein B7733_13105 [Myxococcales bacterium FL481]|nr:MAG: hypothetical protein B7733_13105 [Myxococcales bacterium FL481]